MNTRLTIPLAAIFLVTFLVRSVGTNTAHAPEKVVKTPGAQELMIWQYYEAKTDTPWILIQKNKLSADAPATYFGGFEKMTNLKAPVRVLRSICPHNPQRCATYYVAQAHGFTSPRTLLKGTDYEWVNVRDITASNGSDHGVWAHTRNGNKVLVCPMLVNALKNSSKPA